MAASVSLTQRQWRAVESGRMALGGAGSSAAARDGVELARLWSRSGGGERAGGRQQRREREEEGGARWRQIAATGDWSSWLMARKSWNWEAACTEGNRGEERKKRERKKKKEKKEEGRKKKKKKQEIVFFSFYYFFYSF